MTTVASLPDDLRRLVGERHVLTGASRTRRFRRGYRSGEGPVLAVVRPASLVQMWRALGACVAADVSIILQAANTGLTGGSTPDGDGYPNGVALINTLRLDRIHLLDGGRQVVCLAGATLHALERRLRAVEREPHSVIGSSCIGASVVGGVCNNSGGSLVQRGPAFSELALYAAIGADGHLRLINHLGIALGDDPETILDRIERGAFTAADIAHDPAKRASDHDYPAHVRDIAAATPARFNADPRYLREASGSAGKLALFAVRLDSFPAERETATFYIGARSPALLTELRRHILARFAHLPVAGEYLHRTAFDIADVYGKDTFAAIEWLGTDRLPWLFALKARVDALAERLGLPWSNPSDRLLQAASRLLPDRLPHRIRAFRDRYDIICCSKCRATVSPRRALT